MILSLKRIAKNPTYTIGKLYINDMYFCDTLEDRDRGLNSSMSLLEINKIKVKSQTAIPTGKYSINMNLVSSRLSKSIIYKSIGAKLPRLVNVPGFDGILIHIGNTDIDSSGCILVGLNKEKGKVLNSKETFFKLYSVLKLANDRKEPITISIL